MPGFSSIKSLVETMDNVTHYTTWRKAPNQATTLGVWFDISLSPGNPVPQYYASTPMVAKQMSRSVDFGIHHSGPVSPSRKFLCSFTAMSSSATPLPMPMRLCDYLLYYPFVDEGSTDEQFMDNTVTLPRYTTGLGVQMMAVIVGAHSLAAGVFFTVNYTNSDGVAGRVTPNVALTTGNAANGSIVTSDRAAVSTAGPFIPLQQGDRGVRSIESITMQTADVGLFTLVLVKPLAQMSIRGVDAPVEANYLKDFAQMPVIEDDAYLNFICCPSGSLQSVLLNGDATFTWN